MWTRPQLCRPQLWILILVFEFIFCIRSVVAQGMQNSPILYNDERNITNGQAPAKEFFPYPINEGVNHKSLFPVARFFQTEFTIQNTGRSYKNHTVVWCYLPLNNQYNQIVPKVNVSDQARIFTDSYGNLFLRFDLEDIPPYSTKILRVDCEVLKSKKAKKAHIAGDCDEEQMKKYLREDELLEVNDTKIIKLSGKLQQKDPFETAKSMFDWVAGNVKYSGFDKQDKGALHGLTYKEGDCTEQAALFTALCRANGIPAKLIWGYRCQGNCQGGERLHTWSEFFTDETWHIADITNRVFDKEYENYIGLVNYHGVDPNPLEKKHRYRLDFTYEDVKTRIDIKSVVRLH